MKSIKFPAVSSAVIFHSYQKKWAQKARQDVDTVSVDSRWFGKLGHTLAPVVLIFFCFPIRLLVPTEGEFVLLTETDQMEESEMSRVVQT